MTITKEQIKAILAHPVEAAAFAEGKAIQYYNPRLDQWKDSDPSWSTDMKYRVKPEPMVYDRWLNGYLDGNSNAHFYGYSSREKADLNASPHRIACIHIRQEYEEGEGLE